MTQLIEQTDYIRQVNITNDLLTIIMVLLLAIIYFIVAPRRQ